MPLDVEYMLDLNFILTLCLSDFYTNANRQNNIHCNNYNTL